jgi:hypothetical protein
MNTTASLNEIRQHRLGLRVAARLSVGAADLPHDVQERLRAAREQALARRKCPVAVTVTAPQSAGQATALGHAGGAAVLGGLGGFGGGLGGLNDGGASWWTRIASIAVAVALAAGLVAIDVNQDDQHVAEVADVDTALLTDDLPPQAYADPGFAQFLKVGNAVPAAAPATATPAP